MDNPNACDYKERNDMGNADNPKVLYNKTMGSTVVRLPALSFFLSFSLLSDSHRATRKAGISCAIIFKKAVILKK